MTVHRNPFAKGGKLMQNLDFALYFNIAFFGIIALGAVVGMVRGMRKSLFAFVTMLIFYVAFFLTVDTVVGLLWTMEIPQLGQWLGSLDVAFSGVTSVSGAVPVALNTYLADTIDPALLSEQAMGLVAGIGIFVLKIVYTILYFTVILVVYKLLTGLIRILFFGSRKGASKNAGIGALFGLANGVMALFMFLIILGGVMSVAQSLLTLMPEESPTEVELAMPRHDLYQAGYSVIPLAGEDPDGEPGSMAEALASLTPMVDAFHANILVQAAGLITVPNEAQTMQVPLNLYLFDLVGSFAFNGQKVALRNELAVFAAAAQILMDSEFSTSGDLAKLQGDEVREVIQLLAASDFVVGALPLAVEMAAAHFEVDLNLTPEQLAAIPWRNELMELGTIAGAILDILNAQEAGSDTITVEGDDIRDLFDAMGNSDLVLLVAEAFLEPWLSNPENQVTMFLTIPANIDWQTEFPAIGHALGAIFDESGTFVLNDLGLNAIVNLSDHTIDLLFESRILVATISGLLTGQALSEGMNLVVPDSVFDGEGYLQKTELSALARSIKLLATTVTCPVEEPDCETNTFSPERILTLSEAEVDTLLSSQILAATMGKKIYDLSGTFVIPNAVIDSVVVDGTAVDLVAPEEIKAVFLALMALGSEGFESVNFDAGIFSSLESETVPGTLDHDKLNQLFDSAILHATVSKMLIDLTGDQDLLVVPQWAFDNSPIYDPGTQMITKGELIHVMDALFAMGVDDFNSLGTLDPAWILDNIDMMLDSAILHATISDLLLEGTQGVLIIPDADALANPIRVTRGAVTFVSEAEIRAIVDAMDLLGVGDFGNINLTPAVIFAADYATILASASMQATFSDVILANALDETAPKGTASLIVPSTVRQDLVIGGVSQAKVQIENTELIDLLDAIQSLGLTSFGGGFPAATITAMSSGELDDLLSSASIHLTFDRMLQGNDNIDDMIPNLALVDLYGVPDHAVVTAVEIRNFILAANTFSGGDFTTVSVNYTTLTGLNAADLDLALDSMIVRNAITPDLVQNVNDYNTVHPDPICIIQFPSRCMKGIIRATS
jgi:hypothetical protein